MKSQRPNDSAFINLVTIMSTKNSTIDMSNIICGDIDDNYAHGRIDGKPVIVMRRNGYICASNISGAGVLLTTSGGKAFCETLERNYKTEAPIIHAEGKSYLHPCLAIHLMRIDSPEKAVESAMMALNECLKTPVKIAEEILEVPTESDLLQKMIEMKERLDLLTKQQKSMKKKQNDVIDRVEILEAMPPNLSYDEGSSNRSFEDDLLIIVKNNHKPKEGEKRRYPYTALKCCIDEKEKALKKHKKYHKNMEVLMSLEYDSNILDLWQECIDDLPNKSEIKLGSERKGKQSFDIAKRYSEDDMIDDIRYVWDGRND